MSEVTKKEEKILRFWKREKIYQKVKMKSRKNKKFYFLDGPPYVTGYVHMGTALNKVLKDFFLRFFRMYGFNVWDQPGYDTHGIPIEIKVEKKLGFRTKKDIEKFGVEKFIGECKKFATQFIGIMSKQFFNLGVWMDWKNPYLTLSNEYIQGAWYTFKQGFKNGLLYKDVYPVHVCPRCETAVAYNEIEYERIEDPSIYVKFPIKDKEFLIIWTTTPWTLPANIAIMVKPSAEYVKVKIDDEIWIVAKKLLENLMKNFGIRNYKIIKELEGKKLIGLKYKNPIAEFFPFTKEIRNGYFVVGSEQFVSLEEGTGLVHSAPGHGQEDFKVGLEYDLPVINPLKLDGTFNEKCGEFSGIFAKDANKLIIEKLREKGVLIKEEKIVHEYPTCWRCKSPLLLQAIEEWFFAVTKIREKMLKENEKINWVPKWAKERFKNWIENLGDWPISRKRYWGIPLPIWVCENCKKIKVVGSVKELPKVPKDLHKPYIDKIVWKCKKCKKGLMKRIPDVLDVWFDSGVAPWASLGFPKRKRIFNRMWPVDFVLEGPDQIRGWWNSLMITSLLTFGRRSFENVLFHGFVLDAHGVKMSKSKGNVVEPEEVIEKYGRDVLRFYFLHNEPWKDYLFKWEDVEEVARNLNIVRNIFNFVKIYVTEKGSKRNLRIEDKWIISRLNSVIEECTNYCKSFQPHKAAREILNFLLDDFSRWYLKLIRDRVWIGYEGKDKKAAFFTLLYVTDRCTRILAPFIPFLAEDVYQEILKKFGYKEISIHLLNWPKVEKRKIDKRLEEQMEIVKRINEAILFARNKIGIKLRWPLKEVLILTKNKKVEKAVKRLKSVLKNVSNVKNVSFVKRKVKGYEKVEFEGGIIFVCKKLDEKLLEEALIREIIRNVQEVRKRNKFKVWEKINLYFLATEKIQKLISKQKKKIAKEVNAEIVKIGKLKGKFKGELKFEDKKIEFSFERV